MAVASLGSPVGARALAPAAWPSAALPLSSPSPGAVEHAWRQLCRRPGLGGSSASSKPVVAALTSAVGAGDAAASSTAASAAALVATAGGVRRWRRGAVRRWLHASAEGATALRAFSKRRNRRQSTAGPTVAVVERPDLAKEHRCYLDRVEDYLVRVGGQCTIATLLELFPITERVDEKDVLGTRFALMAGTKDAKTLVCVRSSDGVQSQDLDFKATRVLRELVRRGGSADMHDMTRRFAVPKKALLEHCGGSVFAEGPGGQLVLAGGAGVVARAAAEAGTNTRYPGRWKPGSLLTSTGAAVDRQAADKLQLRLEGFLTTVGDGSMPARMVYEALELTPSPALRRWFRKVGLKMGANGNLSVAEHRIAHYRVRRALAVAELLARSGGQASWDDVVARVHRPWELEELGASSPAWSDCGPSEPVRARALLTAGSSPLYLPGPAGETDERLAQGVGDETVTDTGHVPLEAPLWIEVWLRHFFTVVGNTVYFPPDPQLQLPSVPHPNSRRAPLTMEEEKTLLMSVEEELRLRYGRAHGTVLMGSFEGVRMRLLKRFYDVTEYGDVLAKSVSRQMQEGIAIGRRIMESEGTYTADDCFQEIGMTRTWVETHFEVAEDGSLSFDMDAANAWNAPLPIRAPSPWKYAKLNAPRGYIRKGGGYSVRRYGPSAGGVLY